MKPIELSAYDRVLVEGRIAEFLADTTSLLAWEREEVAREYVLPLSFSWTGFFALKIDGQIVWIGEDWPELPHIMERWRNIALFEGSRRYPEIQALVVARPPDAIDCPDCGGTGRIIVPEALAHIKNIMCSRGGLGWAPRDDPG